MKLPALDKWWWGLGTVLVAVAVGLAGCIDIGDIVGGGAIITQPTPTPTPDPMGACCLPTNDPTQASACTVVEADACAYAGGTWRGGGSGCPTACLPAPTPTPTPSPTPEPTPVI